MISLKEFVNVRPWLTVPPDSVHPIWPGSKDPRFMLKYCDSTKHSDVFHVGEQNLATTLRLDSGVRNPIIDIVTPLSPLTRPGCR